MPKDCTTSTATAANDESSEAAPARRSLIGAAWNWLSGWHILGTVLIFLTVLVALLVVYRALHPHQWIFSVQARSRIIDLTTPPDKETRWRVNNALLCVPLDLVLPADKFAPVASGGPACGGRRWKSYRILAPEMALVLAGSIGAHFELRDNKSLYLALRLPRPDPEQPAGKPTAPAGGTNIALPPGASLSFTDGSADISLLQDNRLRATFIFPAAGENTLAERLFPFIAETTIGRDINWTGTSLLTAGSIAVYTADESPDKRKQVDEADLLMGDQLRLYRARVEDRTVYPRGFIRLAANADTFNVIAFGAANHVRIERFGDNGYDFRPGLLLLLLNDPLLILVLSIFAGVVTLVTAIAGVSGRKP